LASLSVFAEDNSTIKISGVDIVGNQRIDTNAIVAQLNFKSGAVREELITEEIKSLYKTGYFSQVTAEKQAQPTGAYKIVYTVVEKPVIRKVFIQGNKEISQDSLRDIFKFGTDRFLDKSRIFTLIKSAISYYQSRGYYDASFDYSVTPVGDNQVDLVLTVTEGERSRIDEVRFEGLTTLDASDLRDVIQTKHYSWWKSWLLGTGRLNKEMLEADKVALRQFFLDHGLVDGSVGDPVISSEDGDIVITFVVTEGKQYKFGRITTSGDTLDGTRQKLSEDLDSESGEVFSATKLRQDAFKITEKFTDVGFAFANVVPQTDANRAQGIVNVDFAVSKGKPVEVNQVLITGNDKTYDHVIRRELTVDEKSLYSSSKVKRSQALLERLGYFQEVGISTQPTTRDDQVDLLVNVRETSTGQFSAGAGFSSSDGPIFNARVSENNLFGTGRSASVNLDVGTQRDNVQFNFSDRRIDDTFWSGSVNLVRSFREYSDFDRVLTGGSAELGYPLEQVFGESFEDINFAAEYELYHVNIENVDEDDAAQLVKDSEGKSVASSITWKLNRNTINNPLDPKSGSRQTLAFETAGLGGDQDYYLGEARQQLYLPLIDFENGPLVFSWRTTLAYGETKDGDPFPLFKRFFPGGINSVRGYKSRRLGPRDENGNEYGGSKQLINNFEMIFPLVPSAGFKGVTFFDAGEAFDDDDPIQLGDLRRSWGYGIRWNSPLGPIRVEFGYPLDKREGDKSMTPMFAFGAPF